MARKSVNCMYSIEIGRTLLYCSKCAKYSQYSLASPSVCISAIHCSIDQRTADFSMDNKSCPRSNIKNFAVLFVQFMNLISIILLLMIIVVHFARRRKLIFDFISFDIPLPQKGGDQPMSFWEEKYIYKNERKKKIYEILRNREDR
jgi:hypothetical protein